MQNTRDFTARGFLCVCLKWILSKRELAHKIQREQQTPTAQRVADKTLSHVLSELHGIAHIHTHIRRARSLAHVLSRIMIAGERAK